ncbi:MAG: SCO4848 family membrane protein [Canibacter sp.]
MTILLAVLLFVNAGFNIIVWPPFLRRIKKDSRAYDASGRPTRFLTVHVVLITSGLVIAAASLVGAIAALLV